MRIAGLISDINDYVKQKRWYWYLPVWLLGIYIFVKLLSFSPNESQPFIIAIPSAFDFFLHEMAHIFTGFLPDILTAAAGSFSELLLGGLLVYGAFKTRCYFASLLCGLWFMLAAQSAGIYMADARAQQLQLVSIGGELSGSNIVIHDWNFVFGKLHLLKYDTIIGNSIRGVGITVGLLAIVFSTWLMYKMAVGASARAMVSEEADLLASSAAKAGIKNPKVEHFVSIKEGSLYPEPTKGRLADKPVEPPASTDK